MFVDIVPNRKSPPAILLRESYREGGKTKKRTIANLSFLPLPVAAALKLLLKGGAVLESGLEDSFDVVRSLPHGHVSAVVGMIRKLKLDRMVDRLPSRRRDLVVAMVAARIIDPASKLATARSFAEETATNTLAGECGLGDVSEGEMYKAMDWLILRQQRIEANLARRRLEDGTVVLYDVSSTYFEGKHCPLAQYGHNRDGKKGKLQIVFGLLCDRHGCPVAVEVFAGNVGDPSTVAGQIRKLQERFGLSRVVMVGDRGMLTEARLREDLKPVDGIDWITALRGPAIRQLLQEKMIQPSLFDQRGLMEIKSDQYPGERLIACYNPLMRDRRRRKREELLAATEAALEKIAAAIRRQLRPLRGAEKIGIRVGGILNKYKVGKHFQIQITDDCLAYQRHEERIQEESRLDGMYVIRTSVAPDAMGDEETVATYKRLSSVERAFRSMKSVDLKVRPIHHRLEDRVKAHVFLCMPAYYVEWHMRQALKPILFDDEHRQEADARRESVVAPARRSAKTEKKVQKRRTEEGLPVHSFQSLLKDLATITKDLMEPTVKGYLPFQKTTRPTRLQSKAFELLGVQLKCVQ